MTGAVSARHATQFKSVEADLEFFRGPDSDGQTLSNLVYRHCEMIGFKLFCYKNDWHTDTDWDDEGPASTRNGRTTTAFAYNVFVLKDKDSVPLSSIPICIR